MPVVVGADAGFLVADDEADEHEQGQEPEGIHGMILAIRGPQSAVRKRREAAARWGI